MTNCDCITSGFVNKPKQHGVDPHAKNCIFYTQKQSPHMETIKVLSLSDPLRDTQSATLVQSP